MLADYLNKDKYQILIDGIDISNEMIKIASSRNYYDQLSTIDVFDVLEAQNKKYDFVVSIGMFTHSHVGPRAIENILNYLDDDGVFIFTVRNSYREKENFEKFIDDLLKRGKISKFTNIENQNYIDEEKCSVYTLFV